ncbi:MAG: pre-peptidase C-terminal domain-containing protein, partial [Spirochaetota bacterium]
MKTLRTTIGILALLLVLLAAGCSNPLNRFFGGEGGEGGEGTLSVTLSVPNYQDHSASEPASRAISPDSRYMEIYIYDGELGTDRPGPAWSDELYWDGEASASNGFFYTVYESSFGVVEGTYDHVEVILYDGNGGSVLTTGSASAVTVNGGAENRISVTLTPPDGMFTDLPVGGAAVAGTVNNRSMNFYRFTATAGTSYDVTITPSTGKPDVYLFDPDGVRPGTVLATADNEYEGDYIQTEGAELTMTTYAVPEDGTYYLGVYGWDDPSDDSYDDSGYGIAVAEAATDVPRPSDPPPPAEGTVGYYVDEALTALDEERYNDALSEFTNALLVDGAEDDPEYGVAFAGYNALYLMTGLTHPDVVAVARDNLGLADYPNDMDELLTGSWLQNVVETSDYQYLAPRITGQSDLDGDGVVDGYERSIAMMEYFVTHNAGFADVANPALAVLESRLDNALQQIDAMGPDQLMTFTWNMVYDDLDEIVSYFHYSDGTAGYAWPVDAHGNPIDVVIGKADLRLLAAMGQMLKVFIHQGQVYDLNLTQALLQDYYDDYNPEDGTAWNDPPTYTADSPFATGFLGATADATTHLA